MANNKWGCQIRRFKEASLLSFWIAVIAEYIASLLFVVLVCGVNFEWTPRENGHVALSTGLGIAMLANMFWDISGGQFNPAVSVALLVAGKQTFFRSCAYVIVQVLGCMTGGGVLYAITPQELRGQFALIGLGKDVTPFQGFCMEFILTFFLIWTILVIVDSEKKNPGYTGPLAIGIAVAVNLYIGIPYTGAATNPLRSLGPALVTNNWKNHWIYWIANLSCASFTAVLYRITKYSLKLKKETSDNEDVEAKATESGENNLKYEKDYSESMAKL